MNFASDNVYHVHPEIMRAVVDANARLTNVAFCNDDDSHEAEAQISELFEKKAKLFFVLNGTGANSLALSALCAAHGAILCHESSHINLDEGNCPALFTGGAKLIAIPGFGCKLTPDAVLARLAPTVHDPQGPKPSAISISQATELGTVYTLDEVGALGETARKHGLRFHMDGARFANALLHLGCTPAELTWKAGVDALYLGGSKNGAMNLECVVFFDEDLAKDFRWKRKSVGQQMSKGWFLSSQLLAYLKDGLWLDNARRANAQACKLETGLAAIRNVRLAAPVQANEVFPILPAAVVDRLRQTGANFLDWPCEGLAPGEACVRLVTSFATPDSEIQNFLALMQQFASKVE